MGYFQGYDNYEERCYYYSITKKCIHCGTIFIPKSPNQKYCSRENNPACDDDRISQKLWDNNKHPLQLNTK